MSTLNNNNAAVAALQFALDADDVDPMAFLQCWLEGDFEAIRAEWPEAPEAVFIGADPLHPGTKAQLEGADPLDPTEMLTLWREAGGDTHGPNVEIACIPLDDLPQFVEAVRSTFAACGGPGQVKEPELAAPASAEPQQAQGEAVYVRVCPRPHSPAEEFVEIETEDGRSLSIPHRYENRHRLIGPLYLAPPVPAAVPKGWDRDDLEALADGLDCYEPRTVNVGDVTGDGRDHHLPTSTVEAARFIRAVLASTTPAAVLEGLTFNALRSANIKRITSSKYRRCEEAWAPAHWMQATVGELGELANLLKKVDRGDFTLSSALPDVCRELADVQTYLDILALKLGVDLGQATVEKFNEVSERIGSPVRLSAPAPAESQQAQEEEALALLERIAANTSDSPREDAHAALQLLRGGAQ